KTTITDPLDRTREFDQYRGSPTLTVPADTFTAIFSVSGAAVNATTYSYDGHAQQSGVIDAQGKAWTSTFDLLGQATSRTDPDGGTTTNIRYDGNGKRLESTDARGTTISFTYDALGRRTGKYASAVAAQAPSNQLAKWVYDSSDTAIVRMKFAIGHETTSVAYWNGSAYTKQQKNFNVFGESTGVTIT